MSRRLSFLIPSAQELSTGRKRWRVFFSNPEIHNKPQVVEQVPYQEDTGNFYTPDIIPQEEDSDLQPIEADERTDLLLEKGLMLENSEVRYYSYIFYQFINIR
jgi:hypothetical protein